MRGYGIAAAIVLWTGSFSSVALLAQGQSCPPPYEVPPNAFALEDYQSHMAACTAACNAAGYCCTSQAGLCAVVPCITGCHVAWFTSDVASCKSECDTNANVGSCEYNFRHPDVGLNSGIDLCGDASECGCALDSGAGSVECDDQACAAGCDFANSASLQSSFFHGPSVTIDPHLGLSEELLLSALSRLTDHVVGATTMTAAQIVAARNGFSAHAELLETTLAPLEQALDLVDEYESRFGPLFLNAKTNPDEGFERMEDATVVRGDGKDLEAAMLLVQQQILFQVYFAPPNENELARPKAQGTIIQACKSLLEGRAWQTSRFFPGYVIPPSASDAAVVHSITVDATVQKIWGRLRCFHDDPKMKATGLYLAPGAIATVTVPSIMVNAGFEVQIGASTVDMTEKQRHPRMDRVTSAYPIDSTTVTVASPLGGGVYLKVPYLANLGEVTFQVTGGVIQAPYFSKSMFRHVQ
jgi:hypothetical protein